MCAVESYAHATALSSGYLNYCKSNMVVMSGCEMNLPIKRNVMNYNRILSVLAGLCLLFMSSQVFAFESRKDYFLRPQIGGWFGPITPIYKTGDLVDASIGGGLFFRYNTPYRPIKVGVDSSYQFFPSKGVNRMHFIPLYASAIYLLPLNLPVKLQVKGGFGGAYIHIFPDDRGRWDPLFMTGIEMSFPAGRVINIGARIDYIYVYEGYLDGAKMGGHFLNTGIALFFNVNF